MESLRVHRWSLWLTARPLKEAYHCSLLRVVRLSLAAGPKGWEMVPRQQLFDMCHRTEFLMMQSSVQYADRKEMFH